jgi:phosphoglucomutase
MAHPLAGKPAPQSMLVNVPRLVSAYYTTRPDPAEPGQRIAFGTSGHRGSSCKGTFNEDHILAVTQALCDYRREQGIDGPLFLGKDTHALSEPAFSSAVEVLAGNGVEVVVQDGGGYTPTPVISHAILTYNRSKGARRADGVVITPSHNPPEDGGFKYNPPDGGPADTGATRRIEDLANGHLMARNKDVRRMALAKAMRAKTTHRSDYIGPYANDLANVLDMDAVREARLSIGADPMGGSGLEYWDRIAERHGLSIDVVNRTVDPTFGFMSVDKDGKIRMDCSSPYAMARLIGL